MLAVPWRAPFTDPGWTFEVKWDGVRVALGWDGAAVSARSRNGNDLLAAFPELESFRWPRPGLIDAELVTFDERGTPSFARLQQRLGASGLRARELAHSMSCLTDGRYWRSRSRTASLVSNRWSPVSLWYPSGHSVMAKPFLRRCKPLRSKEWWPSVSGRGTGRAYVHRIGERWRWSIGCVRSLEVSCLETAVAR